MFPDALTNVAYFSGKLPAEHLVLYARLTAILSNHRISVREIAGTRDVWCRDYMPVQVCADAFVQFAYKPDYRVAEKFQGRLTGPEAGKAVVPAGTWDCSDLVLDGGNVVHGGSDTVIISEAVLRMNTKFDREWILAQLKEMLQVDRVIFIPVQAYDATGRANTIMRFVDEGTVMVNDYTAIDQIYGKKLEKILYSAGLRIVRIPCYYHETPHAGIPLTRGNYMSFIQMRGVLILPVYGLPGDDVVIRIVKETFPGIDVVLCECGDLARMGGSLDAVVWGVYEPAGIMPNKRNAP